MRPSVARQTLNQPMKKIAIISSQAFSLVNFRGELICDLVKAGARVFALAPDFDNEVRRKVTQLGAQPVEFSLSRTGTNAFRDALDTIRLALVLRRLSVDATLGYFIKPVVYGTLAAWLAGVPRRVAMIEGLGFVFIEPPGKSTLPRRILKKLVSTLYYMALKRAHTVVFLNVDDVREFVDSGLVDSSKATCLGGIGVDLTVWTAAPAVTHPVTFLLAARLLREKGIVEYVEAARRIKAIQPTARFILLGDLDPNPGSLSRTEVSGWAEEGIIEWPGHVAVRPWLEQTSVYVLPSYREGVPRSTQEAMAMARPIITTDTPGCRETVIEGKNGYLVPVRDFEVLVMRMIAFIENPELIVSMGQESRRIAEERFDVRRANKKMMEILGV